ncbi:aspartic peptidase A1 [Ramaria rubella]|nr:aspartic peptidase A1 [Ramaria rubella]
MFLFNLLYLFAVTTVVVSGASSPLVTPKEPLATLSFTTRLNLTSGIKLPDFDRARAKVSVQRANKGPKQSTPGVSFSVANTAVSYLATVGVGNPPTNYSLLIDTGSSNTWVGATQAYVQTSTSFFTGDFVEVMYGTGFYHSVLDQVTLAPNLVITNQSIGSAIFSQDFQGTDGILGIGPTDLTEGSLSSPDTTTLIPTVTDNLFSQLGISFEPTTATETTNGELTFGGTDSRKFTGDINFTPITSTSPSSEFWGIDQTVTYGTNTTLLSLTAGIVELSEIDALSTYQAVTGAVLDETTGLLSITEDQFSNLQSLFLNINGVDFELTANAQLWPRALNTAIGGQADSFYLIVGDLGTPSGEGFDFVNGFAFLERFYAVFDTTNSQVGLATTRFTNATVN